jgi:hypothetical protein
VVANLPPLAHPVCARSWRDTSICDRSQINGTDTIPKKLLRAIWD